MTESTDGAGADTAPGAQATGPQRELLALLTARTRDALVRPPFYVDGADDLVTVCRQLSAQGLTAALVRDGPARLGIFTTTDLRDALLRPTAPAQTPVREVAHFDLVEVQADSDLFEALWLMESRRVRRLVVREGSVVLGLLDQLDLASLVASHSQIATLQIDAAGSLAELLPAARRIDGMIGVLHGSGIRVDRIARLVSELNTRLLRRLWALTASPALQAGSCLLVMGSEGRGEQLLKTDQDNALLLRDGFDCPELEDVTTRFSAGLAALGWPPCPGGVMLSNPRWRQPLAQFRHTLRGWVYGKGDGSEPDSLIQLAIFFDARAVAGDATLLQEARAYLDSILFGQDTWLARFAAAADQFHESGHWFARLTTPRDEQPVDVKKLGIFPIVHGVRALALQQGVHAQGTVARLAALAPGGPLDAALLRDLPQALHLLMSVRLTHQLRRRAQGQPADNELRPSELGTLEREPLRDALTIVKRLRASLRQHFRFDLL